jgi:hypothetical protein
MLAPAPLGLKTVLRLLVDAAGSVCLGAAGGGGTEKRARSCSSVSRIRLVISWFWSSAFVNILDGAKLSYLATVNPRHEGILRQFRNGGGTERDLLQMRVEQRHDGHELIVAVEYRGRRGGKHRRLGETIPRRVSRRPAVPGALASPTRQLSSTRRRLHFRPHHLPARPPHQSDHHG